MSREDHLLNYVRCPYCGGNAAVSHPCDEDAIRRASEEAFARFMASVEAPVATATPEQLRSKLAECEEALRTTEEAFAASEAERDRLAALLVEARRQIEGKARYRHRAALAANSISLREFHSGAEVGLRDALALLTEPTEEADRG